MFGEYEEGVLADFKLTDEEIDFLCSHDMVVTGLWGNVHDDLAKIQARGVKVAFDAATRPEDPAAVTAIPSVDYLFFATDDGDTPELRETMKQIKAKGPKLVITTLGEKGSIVYDGEKYTTFGIIPVSYTHLDVYKRQDKGRPGFKPLQGGGRSHRHYIHG